MRNYFVKKALMISDAAFTRVTDFGEEIAIVSAVAFHFIALISLSISPWVMISFGRKSLFFVLTHPCFTPNCTYGDSEFVEGRSKNFFVVFTGVKPFEVARSFMNSARVILMSGLIWVALFNIHFSTRASIAVIYLLIDISVALISSIGIVMKGVILIPEEDRLCIRVSFTKNRSNSNSSYILLSRGV